LHVGVVNGLAVLDQLLYLLPSLLETLRSHPKADGDAEFTLI